MCNHIWMTEYTKNDIAHRRECQICKKKQTISYLGGSLWYWVDELI